LEDLGVNGILKYIFKKWVWEYGLDWSGSGHEQVAGTCKLCNEPSSSTECGGISWLAEELLACQEKLLSHSYNDTRITKSVHEYIILGRRNLGWPEKRRTDRHPLKRNNKEALSSRVDTTAADDDDDDDDVYKASWYRRR
jgi:hypothetical protein